MATGSGKGGMDSEEFSCAVEEAENYAFMDPGGKGNCDRKRRFSEEQIRLLESMFETQNKLEPKKKAQLARELGLQPRQVAIWFQNKRARCKSKQLEREYNTLRADYEALLCSFESLKKDKQFLVKQLQTLYEVLDKQADQSSNDGDSDKSDVKKKEDIKPTELLKEGSIQKAMVYPDDEEKKPSYFSHEEDNVLYAAEPAAVSLASAEQQRCLNGSCFPDQCCCTTCPQWWEFWPVQE